MDTGTGTAKLRKYAMAGAAASVLVALSGDAAILAQFLGAASAVQTLSEIMPPDVFAEGDGGHAVRDDAAVGETAEVDHAAGSGGPAEAQGEDAAGRRVVRLGHEASPGVVPSEVKLMGAGAPTWVAPPRPTREMVDATRGRGGVLDQNRNGVRDDVEHALRDAHGARYGSTPVWGIILEAARMEQRAADGRARASAEGLAGAREGERFAEAGRLFLESTNPVSCLGLALRGQARRVAGKYIAAGGAPSLPEGGTSASAKMARNAGGGPISASTLPPGDGADSVAWIPGKASAFRMGGSVGLVLTAGEIVAHIERLTLDSRAARQAASDFSSALAGASYSLPSPEEERRACGL